MQPNKVKGLVRESLIDLLETARQFDQRDETEYAQIVLDYVDSIATEFGLDPEEFKIPHLLYAEMATIVEKLDELASRWEQVNTDTISGTLFAQICRDHAEELASEFNLGRSEEEKNS